MDFDHERLDVYQLALDFLVVAERLVRELPKGRAHFTDQLGRAALSIVLNVAEGAGKTSPPDKRRYYQTARGSATECAALFDALLRVGLVSAQDHRLSKEMLLRIVAMLVKLTRAFEPVSVNDDAPDPAPRAR